jgi:signal transduction histidine kinase
LDDRAKERRSAQANADESEHKYLPFAWQPDVWARSQDVLDLMVRLRADLVSRLFAALALTAMHVWVTGSGLAIVWFVLLCLNEAFEGVVIRRVLEYAARGTAGGAPFVVAFLFNLAFGGALWALAALSFWQAGDLGGTIIGLTVIAGSLAHVAILYTTFSSAQIAAAGPLVIGLIAMPTTALMTQTGATLQTVQVIVGFLILVAYVLFVGSEASRSQAKLRESVHQANAANAAKLHFLAVMSHEIRNPLGAVSGSLDLVSMSGLTDDQRHILDMARRSVNDLTGLLNDILDLSKLEAGRMELHLSPVAVRDLVRETLVLFASLAADKGVTLQARIGADVPEVLETDGARLRQILSNFLSNAVKFTHKGSIDVDVRLLAGSGFNRLLIAVTDSGVGIPADVQARLFEPFSQADETTHLQYGGTGLGLSICRRLAQALGGEVGCESVPEVGSRFWVEIAVPAAKGNAAAEAAGENVLPFVRRA